VRTSSGERLVKEYLARLRAAGRALPRAERRELESQIEEHLRDALPAGADEAETRSALDRLGSPEAVIAEHLDRVGARAGGAGAADWSAVILLLFGGLLAMVGWFVGVVLLWRSHVWSAREKVIGTLLVPGGLATTVLLALILADNGRDCVTSGSPHHATVTRCTGGTSTLHDVLVTALLVAVALTSVATAAFLARRASVASV